MWTGSRNCLSRKPGINSCRVPMWSRHFQDRVKHLEPLTLLERWEARWQGKKWLVYLTNKVVMPWLLRSFQKGDESRNLTVVGANREFFHCYWRQRSTALFLKFIMQGKQWDSCTENLCINTCIFSLGVEIPGRGEAMSPQRTILIKGSVGVYTRSEGKYFN